MGHGSCSRRSSARLYGYCTASGLIALQLLGLGLELLDVALQLLLRLEARPIHRVPVRYLRVGEA